MLCFPWQVFKMLGNKESLDQIIVATPGLSSDPVALGESSWDPEGLRKGGKGESQIWVEFLRGKRGEFPLSGKKTFIFCPFVERKNQ